MTDNEERIEEHEQEIQEIRARLWKAHAELWKALGRIEALERGDGMTKSVIITCRCGDCGACDARCIHGFLDATCRQCNPEVA